jgi:ubiquinone/menaquinone biosynthesis C-methylase UbiE
LSMIPGMTLQTDRAVSFGIAAHDYDRYRVGPPAEIADLLAPTPCASVLDLGAGTGALTRVLAARVPQVYAVDRDPRMIAVLERNCPGVTAMEGTAERIPLPDAAVEAVTAASAWHWMDPELAVPEVTRVLRPGGTLGLMWNRRDRTAPWIAELEAFRLSVTGTEDWIEERVHHYLEQPWLPAGSRFGRIETGQLPWHTVMTRDEVAGLMTTFHGFLTVPDELKPAMVEQFEEYAHSDAVPGIPDREDLVEIPMMCHFWRASLD